MQAENAFCPGQRTGTSDTSGPRGSTGFPPRAFCSALSGCLLHTEASEWLSPCFFPEPKTGRLTRGKLGTGSEVENLMQEAQSPFLPGQINKAATGLQSFSSGYQGLGVRAGGDFLSANDYPGFCSLLSEIRLKKLAKKCLLCVLWLWLASLPVRLECWCPMGAWAGLWVGAGCLTDFIGCSVMVLRVGSLKVVTRVPHRCPLHWFRKASCGVVHSSTSGTRQRMYRMEGHLC